MFHVPYEIWLNIAYFLHPVDLERLISVNSAFYDVAMDARYRQMSFSFLDEKMLRNIVRLRDPAVAKRVRILHVYPAFLKQAADRKESFYTGQRSLRFKFEAWVNHVLGSKHALRSKLQILQQLNTVDDLVRMMLDVFKGLPNVIEYNIMWFGLQLLPESPVPFLSAGFHCSRLRKLSLDISLENIPDLLAPHRAPTNIQELDLIIRSDHSVSASKHALIMINHLAPAITRLKSSLEKLTIQAWEPLNLAPLFLTLDRLPCLEHLALGIPLASPHLGDPLGVCQFLNRQSPNLSTLSLRVTQYSGPGLAHVHVSIDNWIVSALANTTSILTTTLTTPTSATRTLKIPTPPRLQKLEISSSLFPPAAAFACLLQFSTSITSLVLTGCYHTLSDITAILGAFRDRPRSQRLETLRLGSVILTPDLVDLLSEELPNLKRLELLVREVGVIGDGGVPMAGVEEEDEYMIVGRRKRTKPLEQFEYFMCEMEKRSYPKWNLRSLKILLTTIPYHFPYGPHLEQLLAACVPSIEGFRCHEKAFDSHRS